MRGRTQARRSGRLIALSAAFAAVVALVVVVLVAPRSEAAPVVPFAPRFATDDNGTVSIFGNNLMTCPPTDARCAGTRSGATVLNNNSFTMQLLDADTDPSTFDSSSAEVAAPPGGEVLWAGLYWGARLSRGNGGAAGVGDRRAMLLRAPGGAYTPIAATADFGPTAGDQAYQEFADVTALVRTAGSGTYWGANVVAGTGEDRYAGWSLVVVYRAPGLPLRNLTVFDGFSDVGQGNPQQVVISGFRTPLSGPVETELGMVAYEGDPGTSGDTARLNQTLLSTPLSKGTNFFNSTDDDHGSLVTARRPADANMLGFDIKNLSAAGIPNGATSATISLDSTGDRYFPGVVTTAIRLFAPDFTTSTKTVANLAGRTPAFPGDTLEYTITYPNTGQDAAVGSVMTDTLPPGTTFVSAAPSSGACTGSGRDVRCTIGTIPVGGTWQARVQATVQDAAAGTTLRNAAVLDYTAQTLARPLSYVVAPASIPVSAVADLSLSKSMAPDPGVAGGDITATLRVTNSGPSPAQDVQLEDPLPAGVTFVSATPDQGSCSFAAGTVTCSLGTVAAGATVSTGIVMRVPSGSTASTVVNAATVSSPTADPDPSNNSAGAAVPLTRRADLVVTKTADPATVVPGASTAYTVTVRNDGPSDAADVAVTDMVGDPRLALVSASAAGATCTVAADVARCTLPTLAAGQSLTMTVGARLSPDTDAGVALENTASATTTTAETDTANNTATATITAAAPQADLSVAKSVGAIMAGGQATYTVVVTNKGASTARAATLADPLPAGLTAVSATSTRGTCTVAATVTCALGDIPGPDATGVPSSATVTIVADVAPDATGVVSNTATAASDTSDPVPGDDSATASAPVTASADVSIAKTVDDPSPAAGSDVVYTVTAHNAGPAAARDVVISDALPPGLDLVSVTPPAGVTCTGTTTLTCPIGILGDGASAVVTVTMHVPAGFDLNAGAVNSASISSSTPDPAPLNDTAEATITSRALSDLGILKWDTTPGPPAPGTPPRAFTAGETVTYRIAALNQGPSDATTVRVTDVLPAGVSFVSSVPQCSFQAPATVTCDLPTVPSGFAGVFPIVVRVDPDLPAGTMLTNTASITMTDPNRVDPTTSNNTATVTNPVVASADVAIAKQTYSLDLPSFGFTTPSAAPAGTPSGYFIDVRNNGPSTARDVVVVDSSTMTRFFVNQIRLINPANPSGLDITAQCSWSGGDLQCPVGDLPPFAAADASWRIQVDGVTLSDAPAGDYVNTVEVSSSTPDSDPSNNHAQAPITVTAPVATLTIAKSVLDPTDVDGDSDADMVPGGTFAYQLDVADVLDLQRSGAADAPDTVVTDALPAGLTATAVSTTQGTCTITPPSTVRCDLGTVLGPGRVPEPPPVRITVSGTVSPGLAGTPTVTNTATVTSPISAPASSSVTQDVVPVADISLTKVADAPVVAAGSDTGFSLIATNAGPSDAAGAQVGDLLPPEIAFDPASSDPSCALADAGGTPYVLCEIGTLHAGETRTVRVGGHISSAQAPVDVVNVAAASSPTTGEYDFSNNRSEAPVSIITSADLVVTKTADVTAQRVGQNVTYSVDVTNAGPSDAAAVALDDTLPAGTTLVSASLSTGGACAETGGHVACAVGALAAGDTATATIVVALPAGLEPGAVVNTATATSTTPDADPANNTATASVDAFVEADLALSKSVVTAHPVAGSPLQFAVDVVDNGPQDAPHVVVTDTLAPGLSFVSATIPGGSCTMTNPEGVEVVTCVGGTLAVGQTVRAVITVLPDPSLRVVTNAAGAGSAAQDPRSADNYAEISTPLAPPVGASPPPPPPTSTPTPSPTQTPTESGGTLATTGGDGAAAAWLIGIALLLAGAIVRELRPRRDRGSDA